MDRREFIGAVTLGVLAAPLAALAQSVKRMPTVGYLATLPRRDGENFDAFREGLRAAGHVEGRTVVVEYRSAEGSSERLPALVKELLALKPAVIMAANPYSIRAVRSATTTVPVVGIDLESDPVAAGLAVSLSRPGPAATSRASSSICPR